MTNVIMGIGAKKSWKITEMKHIPCVKKTWIVGKKEKSKTMNITDMNLDVIYAIRNLRIRMN